MAPGVTGRRYRRFERRLNEGLVVFWGKSTDTDWKTWVFVAVLNGSAKYQQRMPDFCPAGRTKEHDEITNYYIQAGRGALLWQMEGPRIVVSVTRGFGESRQKPSNQASWGSDLNWCKKTAPASQMKGAAQISTC